MSVNILSQPDDLALAKNQVLYRAETDQYITTPGVPSHAEISLPGVPANGETLEILIPGLDLVFIYTFSNSIAVPSSYLVDTSSGVTATVQAELLARLKENYYLERHYNVVAGINIDAKLPGSEYDIIFGGTATVTTPTTGSTPEVRRTDYTMAWDLYEGPDSSSTPVELVAGQFLDPDNEQKVYPDMAQLLRDMLAPDIPDYQTAAIAYNDKSLRKFRVRYGDNYDELVQDYLSTATKKVMLAGIALERWPFVNFPTTYGAGNSNQKFLSNMPRQVWVSRATEHYLCVLVGAEFDVLVNITWDDETTTSNIPLFATVSGNTKSWALIPVGFDRMELIDHMPVGKEYPVSYEVFVQQDGAESEHFKFELDNNYRLFPRNFIFHNSLNGWDCIYATGDQARSLNNIGEDFEIPPPRTFKVDSDENDRVDANQVSEEPEQIRVFSLNTGYRSKDYVQALARELPLSEKVLMDTGSQWLEIKVDKESIKEIDNDSDELWSLTFAYTYGLTDKAY